MTIPALLDADAARQLTARIKVAVEGTWLLIQEAYTSRAWAILGYDTWDAYCAEEFDGARLQLPREERRDVVASLRDAGLSTRAIGAATGISEATVRRELQATTASFPLGDDAVETPRVMGINGKAYAASRPAPMQAAADGDLFAGEEWAEPEPDREVPRAAPVSTRESTLPRAAPARPTPVLLTLRTHTGQEVPYSKPVSAATFNQTSGSGISWAEWSWNPVTGCLHGCNYCYARELANSERLRASYPVGFTPLFHHERLDAPANTAVPAQYRDDSHGRCDDGACKVCAYRRVFVCSMADLYGRWVPDEWIKQVHASCLGNPQWDYIHLTKFPDRYVGLDFAPTSWVGTSVDEQKRVRIAERAFRQIDGVAVKWLSLEPLLEPLEFTDLSVFDWVVIGAQTGTRQPDGHVPAFAPPFEWVARIALQAIDAGCKVHFKPNLINGSPGMVWPDQYPTPGARHAPPETPQVPGQTVIPL